MAYIKLSINADAALAEQLAELLTQQQALSVTLEDAADEEIFQVEPADSPLWKEVSVQALLPTDTSPRELIATLKNELNLNEPLNYKIEKVADQDWVKLTQKNFKPQHYNNKLWICPSWHDHTTLTGSIVCIDPGLAFGTGSHATTSLCLDWLAQTDIAGKTIIDYGCGSGILSLAALALGANLVYAVDHDEQATEATTNNAKLNEFAETGKLRILAPEALPEIQADIVIANILSKPLIDLAPKLIEHIKPGGMLLLSGVLENESITVLQAYSALGIDEIDNRDGWVSIAMNKL